MKKPLPYDKRDSAFGQMIVTMRTNIGLTQVELAERIGISSRAVAAWEAGNSYPKVDHFKRFIALAVSFQTFPLGHEAKEIHALWKAARQKILLDEHWLHDLLSKQHPRLTLIPPAANEKPIIESAQEPRVDWGDALVVPTFYGREQELVTVTQWIIKDRSRVVAVLGMGGIGKSALATSAMYQLATHFEVVIWRSLRDSPSYEGLLDDFLQILSAQSLANVPMSLERRLSLLLEHLRNQRILLVLDNLETLLEDGEIAGHMRPGYEGYARLLRQIAETEHQSTLLLTSREKPSELVSLNGYGRFVRSLRLVGLDGPASQQLLKERNLVGTLQDQEQLIKRYEGNPLALKIVSGTIVELFGGEIRPFLMGNEVVFGNVRELLDEQFNRLTSVEQTVLYWLAILREPVTITELLAVLGIPLPRARILDAMEALRRRSLLEQGKQSGSFTLQAAVMEYMTMQFIEEVSNEIEQSHPARLIELGFELATTKEYVRQAEERLIVIPLLAHLRQQPDLEEQLLALLDLLRQRADYAQGYGPANILALLRQQWGHLRNLDLSRLFIRGASLQKAEMQDTKLSMATLYDTTFTDALDDGWAIATSLDGTYWATGGRRGDVRVWRQKGKQLHLAWQAHSNTVRGLAFSPDGNTLASASWDSTVKLWNLKSGALLWVGYHTGGIQCLAFAPDGQTLASGGSDSTIRLWDAQTGTTLQTLIGHTGTVFTAAWSPDGSLLASGGFDGQIRLWESVLAQDQTSVRVLAAHTNWVMGLTFAPDGRTLASASWDKTVKLWDVESLSLHQVLTRQTDRVNSVTWSLDGRILASCGFDQTIWLWDVEQKSYRTMLHGPDSTIHAIAFAPDSHSLFSGSEDGTLCQWDMERGQCIYIMQGYAVSLYELAWSPDGTHLASAGSNSLVTIWDVETHAPPRILRGHDWIVDGIEWSPNGEFLASTGWGNTIRIWDTNTGNHVQILRSSDSVATLSRSIAWSPDGRFLAGGSYQQGIQVWDVHTGTRLWLASAPSSKIRRVVWSPDGTCLASCDENGSIFLWDASNGTMKASLQGHRGMVIRVAWSPDGRLLASGGGRDGGELFVWDVKSEERLHILSEPSEKVYALAWDPTGELLISGGSDDMLRWWNMQNGECIRIQEGHRGAGESFKISLDGRRLASYGYDNAIHISDLANGERLRILQHDRPYERLDISGVKGLTEAQQASLRTLGAIEGHLK